MKIWSALKTQRVKALVLFLSVVLLLFVAGGCSATQEFIDYLMTPTFTQTVTPVPSDTMTVVPATATETLTLTPEPPTAPPPTSTPVPTDTMTPVPTETLTVTEGPSPTSTRTSTRTRRPSITPSITLTRTPSPTSTITNTPTPPFAYLRLQRPGLFSKVTSPFQISAMVSPGEDGYVYMDLVGEDQRLISQVKLDYRTSKGRRFLISPLIDFRISAAVETARLVMSVNDLFGRKIAVSSVDLLLLSVGEPEVYAPETLLEPYLVRYPKENQVVSGGILTVVGLARPVNDQPLALDLVDEQNQVVGSVKIQVPFPTGDLSHTPFEVGVPYVVETETPARLMLHQESNGRIPGTVALASLRVVLEP